MGDLLTPREAVRRMAPYSPPSGGRQGKLRLDFNENTVGSSPRVIEALTQYLTADHLSIYPEYAEATRKLARFFEVGADEFIMSNGTDEAIQVFINTFVEPGQEVLLLKPSYAMYRFYADLAGASVREIESAEDLSFPFERFLHAIQPSTRAILIANPNNPTGASIGHDEIRAILEAAPQAAVLIDEAYFEFCGVSVLSWIRDHPNLFVSRTFSKVYGMAAMRCGCLFSCAENVRWMHKAQSPYSVNMLAAVAACAAVEDTEYRENYVEEVLSARKMVWDGLTKLGIRCFPTSANFILFQVGDRAIPIRDALRERGVLIRDRSYEIPGCVRVTIGTRAGAQRFMAEFWRLWNQ
ncbi:MAG TPA: histidinol-phosphate transaminase [Bryobacteraceae bacterium]|jgi:histidinol-phosphate aminotransferase